MLALRPGPEVLAASSTVVGTHTITVTFKVTLTITKYKADGTVDSTRTASPYSGNASTTLNVTAGKFKIRLEPDDKCKETATNKRSRTRFGLGEKGDIIVEPETPGDTVVVTKISSSAEDICTVNVKNQKFTLENKPGSATITVEAKINGAITPDEETIGITAIAPTGMAAISKINDPAASFVGSGMYVEIRFEPKDVSFSKSKLGEGRAEGKHPDGTIEIHPKNKWPMGDGDVIKGTELKPGIMDNVTHYGFPLNTPVHTLTWNIPFGYYDLSHNPKPITKDNPLIPFTINPHIAAFDGQGGCVITKFGMKATRVPKNVPNLLNAVKNNTPYKNDWEYTD